MPVEMPPIDSNLDTPLPEVDPNSDVVPYRLARTDPGGQQVVTTGYGPRARPPIQPPGGIGAGAPDLSQGMVQAFQNLPVDQATKAIEAAIRYQAQRGYQNDLQNGSNAAQAFAKWGPMLFHQATGIPEAIDRSVPTPITPQQLIQNRLNQQKFEASQAAVKAKADAAKVMTPYQAAEIELRKQAATKAPAMAPEKKAELTDAYKELDELRKVAQTLPPPERSKKQDDKDKWFENQQKMLDVRKRISKIGSGAALVAASQPPPNPAQPPAPPTSKVLPFPKSKSDAVKGSVYSTKNGPLMWDGDKFVAPK